MSVQGCGSNAKLSQDSLESFVKSKIGSAFAITYNESKRYALCQQTSSKNDQAHRSFKFIVVKVSDKTITNQGSFHNGYAKWIDNNSVEVMSVGSDEKGQPKIINVNDQQS